MRVNTYICVCVHKQKHTYKKQCHINPPGDFFLEDSFESKCSLEGRILSCFISHLALIRIVNFMFTDVFLLCIFQ